MVISTELTTKQKIISVVGLGYVGLPLALEFAKKYQVLGFDINDNRLKQMQQEQVPSNELEHSAFENKDIIFSSNKEELASAHFYVIAVPTDIDEHKVPNLKPLHAASCSVGAHFYKGDYVVFESTVYTGCTEEECFPILEKLSGLRVNEDLKIGYSLERSLAGDKVRTLSKILKIVAGSDMRIPYSST